MRDLAREQPGIPLIYALSDDSKFSLSESGPIAAISTEEHTREQRVSSSLAAEGHSEA